MSGLLYVSLADLRSNTNVAEAIRNLGDDTVIDAIAAASSEAESYISARYSLPFLTYGPDFKKAVLSIVIYDLISERGMSLEGSDANYRLRAQDARAWLKAIASGTVTPQGVIDSTPQRKEGAPVVMMRKPRGL